MRSLKVVWCVPATRFASPPNLWTPERTGTFGQRITKETCGIYSFCKTTSRQRSHIASRQRSLLRIPQRRPHRAQARQCCRSHFHLRRHARPGRAHRQNGDSQPRSRTRARARSGRGSRPHRSAAAHGIWRALICAAAGIAVAIPVHAGYNYLVSRINRIVLDMERAAAEIVNIVTENGNGKPS